MSVLSDQNNHSELDRVASVTGESSSFGPTAGDYCG